MLAEEHQLEVLQLVVGTVMVQVMDDLLFSQEPMEMLLHYESMLEDKPTPACARMGLARFKNVSSRALHRGRTFIPARFEVYR